MSTETEAPAHRVHAGAALSVYMPWIGYGGKCDIIHAMAVIRLVLMLKDIGINCHLTPICGESLIPRARNAAASTFLLRTAHTHLLFIDTDITFDPRDVVSMLQCDAKLIAGVYRTKTDDATEWASSGSFTVTKRSAEAGIYGAQWLPSGFMLIARGCLEEVSAAHPTGWCKNNISGYGEIGADLFNFFPLTFGGDNNFKRSEDYGFCELCAAAGIEPLVFGKAMLGHCGTKIYAGEFHAWIRAKGRAECKGAPCPGRDDAEAERANDSVGHLQS
jgi:hypothetical protein